MILSWSFLFYPWANALRCCPPNTQGKTHRCPSIPGCWSWSNYRSPGPTRYTHSLRAGRRAHTHTSNSCPLRPFAHTVLLLPSILSCQPVIVGVGRSSVICSPSFTSISFSMLPPVMKSLLMLTPPVLLIWSDPDDRSGRIRSIRSRWNPIWSWWWTRAIDDPINERTDLIRNILFTFYSPSDCPVSPLSQLIVYGSFSPTLPHACTSCYFADVGCITSTHRFY